MERKMKDSGIPWIGMIPSDWRIVKLLSVLRNPISDGPHETPQLVETGIPFISVDSLNDSDKVDLSIVRKFISYQDYLEYSKKSKIEKGDILFSKAATIGKTAIVGDEIFMVWSPLAIIKTKETIVANKFVYYILNCQRLIVYVSLLGTYNTQINVGMRALERAIIPLPPFPTQQRIADYLDRKCAEIDELAALQETMIAELKRYKQSVITEAVTKGLDPNVPMKDSASRAQNGACTNSAEAQPVLERKFKHSGVEWIGEIPSAWRTIRLKFLCTIQTGNQDTQDAIADGEYPFYVRSPLVEHSNKFSFEGEGILMAGDGAGAGRVFHHVFGKYAVHQRVYRLANFTSIHSDYLFYFLSSLFCKEMDRGSAQSTVPSVRLPMLQNFCICIPTTAEQRAIADYLDRKCAEIDELIAIKQQKIEALKEYKKSVIFEYVTGKKEI